LRLSINGEQVSTREIDHMMRPTPQGFYVGGTPVGVLPPDEIRFFHGRVQGMRITQDPNGAYARTLEELMADAGQKSLLRLDCRRPQLSISSFHEQSGNQYRVEGRDVDLVEGP
jgi:hypothetical protein